MANQIRKSLSFKKGVEPEVLEFLDKQSNYSDTILYLIQKEIAENGIRDMQLFIPSKRSIESLRELSLYSQSKVATNVEESAFRSENKNDVKEEVTEQKAQEKLENTRDTSEEIHEEKKANNEPAPTPIKEVKKTNIEDEFGEYFN